MIRVEPPDAEVTRLLAAERDFAPEDADLRERALARARDVLANARAPRPFGFLASRRQRLLLAVSIVLVVAAAAVAQWLSSRPTAHPLPDTASSASQTPELPSPTSSPPTEPSSPPTLVAESERSGLSQTPGIAESAPGPRRSSPADGYSLELGLLQRARAALASGGFQAALTAIAEHQRRFPKGHLREEREALRVKTLTGLGRNEEAGRAAEEFRRRFPNSVLAPRIEEGIRQKQ